VSLKRKLIQALRGRERGQILVMAAVLLPVMIGMTGMAIDVGTYASERRQLQNAADAIALAAAQNLPDETAAVSAGQVYAARNNIALADVSITTGTDGTGTPWARAVINRTHEFAFMRAIGVDSSGVSGRAKAVKASFGGSAGIVPWTITQDTQDAATLGEVVVMKYDAEGGDTGNSGRYASTGRGRAPTTRRCGTAARRMHARRRRRTARRARARARTRRPARRHRRSAMGRNASRRQAT